MAIVGDGVGGEDTEMELRGLKLDVVEPRLMGLGAGARIGDRLGVPTTLLHKSANVIVVACDRGGSVVVLITVTGVTVCWKAGGADVTTTVVGIVRATVTIPAEAAAASNTSGWVRTSGRLVAG